jgi:aminoglycoside N3'-acetyltransferase
MAFTKEQLMEDLRTAGVMPGSLLHIKVSMRSVGHVDGGADTLLNAVLDVLGPEGTLVADAFVDSYPLPLSKENQQKVSTLTTPSYAGVFANAMIRHPQMKRSRHPIQRFVAIGARAKELMTAHTPDKNGYRVMEELARLGAFNLNIGARVVGVGTTHVAVEKTGLKKRIVPRGRNYLDDNGEIRLFNVNWNGGCAKGFVKFVPLYEKAGLIKHGKVGNAGTLLTKMAETLKLEQMVLQNDPAFFFCDDRTCKDCRLRWEHSTGNWLSVKFFSALTILKQKTGRVNSQKKSFNG